jgi:hypothetical protein
MSTLKLWRHILSRTYRTGLPFSLDRSVRRTRTRKQGIRVIPMIDGLEDRQLLSGPTTYTVTNLHDSGSGSLRDAIARANSQTPNPAGSLIQFAQGLSGQITLSSTLVLNETDGPEVIAGPGANLLTVNGNNAVRVFQVNDTATLSGLTVSGGNSTSGGQSSYGGGIANNGTLELTNCTLADNSAVLGGGGIANTGTLELTDCTLSHNSATDSNSDIYDNGGGGIYNDSGCKLTLANCTLTDNYSARWGGGIDNYFGGMATLTNCTLSGNSAVMGGGGISNDGTVTLTSCTLSDNSGGSAGVGGGISNGHLADSTAMLTNCTLAENSAGSAGSPGWGGGILNYRGSTAMLASCTLSDNSASAGAGICNGGTAMLANCTLAGNYAGNYAGLGGGGIDNEGTATLTNCTLAGNSAGNFGGGIYNYGTATLTNTIVASNVVGGSPSDIIGTVTGSNNLIGTGGSGGLVNGQAGNLVGVAAPLLAPLGSYGGPTRTVALLPGSPALGAGTSRVTVSISGQANTHLQDFPEPIRNSFTGGIDLPDADTGNLVLGGVPFLIPTDGLNGWNSYNAAGPNPRSIDIPVNIFDATTVYTLINTYWGEPGPGSYAKIEFFGSGGAYEEKDLIGGVDIRNYNAESPTTAAWTQTINGATTTQVLSYDSFGLGQRIDMQGFVLPASFQGQTLEDIRLTDTGGATFFQRLILSGVTVIPGITSDQRGEPIGSSVDIGAFQSQGFVLTPAAGSTPQTAVTGTAFANPLVVTVTANNPAEPVTGGTVSFTAPSSGASATLSSTTATIGAAGRASVTATANVTAGTYAVAANAAGAAAAADFALTNLVPVQPVFSNLVGSTIIYGTPSVNLSGTILAGSTAPPGSVSITVDGDTQSAAIQANGSFSSVFNTASLGVAGSPYTISFAYAGTVGFLAATDTSRVLTVTPATLTITADSKTKVYGAGMPALTASYLGLVNGDTPASLAGLPMVTTTASAASHVGSYAITVSAAASSDYAISYVFGSLSVTPVALTITANNQTKVYGAALPTLTASYTGWVNGDTPASLVSLPILGTVATAASHVGSYAITASGAVSSDYAISYVFGSLSVTPTSLTITASDTTKVYGAAVPALTATYRGFVNGDSTASLTTPPTLNTAATASSHVRAGGCAISALGASDPDYSISYLPGTLTITPAPLTITANNASKVYGAALPALTASYTGFVNGESAASLAARPALATTASASSPVRPGGYAIIAAGASDPDYSISYQPGTLLINPAPLTITANNSSMVQGAVIPALSASYSGFVNHDSLASLNTLPTLSTPAIPLSPPGSYAILVGGASSSNYAINYANGILLVTPAPVKVLKVLVQAIRLGKTKKTTQVIVVQFSGAINRGDAQSTGSYTLTTIPAKKRQKSHSVALSQARYIATTNTVTLITRKPLVLNPPIRLTLNPARLVDPYGIPLSGNSVATLSKRRVTF